MEEVIDADIKIENEENAENSVTVNSETDLDIKQEIDILEESDIELQNVDGRNESILGLTYEQHDAVNNVLKLEAFKQPSGVSTRMSDVSSKPTWPQRQSKKTFGIDQQSENIYFHQSKAFPLTHDQLLTLVKMLQEREAIIFSKENDGSLPAKKLQCWTEITKLFNAKYPHLGTRSVKQIKRSWEYMRRRVKEGEAIHHKHKEAGIGPVRFTLKHLQIAQALMAKDSTIEGQPKSECSELGANNAEDWEGSDMDQSSNSATSLRTSTSTSSKSHLTSVTTTVTPSSSACTSHSLCSNPSTVLIVSSDASNGHVSAKCMHLSSQPEPLRKRRKLSKEEEAFADLKRRQDELHKYKLEAARQEILAAEAQKKACIAIQEAAQTVQESMKGLGGSFADLISVAKAAVEAWRFCQDKQNGKGNEKRKRLL